MTDLFLSDVIDGLDREPKILPCKYFYDARGSELFEQICELPEYYPTRADVEATETNIDAIVAALGPGVRLVELGSGAGVKTRILLSHLREVAAYVPIEISEAALDASAARLAEEFPQLTILPVAADYTLPFELPEAGATATRTVIYFPGSTIGNFHPPDAIQFMRRLRRIADGVLIGVDLKKDKAILERAYDDAAGVTAAFNLNLLVRMQRELGAELDLDGFEHMARYDEAAGRIEMHLVSRRDQAIVVGNRRFDLRAGETIRSEVSYKYSLPEFATVAMESGWEVEQVWTDRQGRFSLQYLAAR
ncbi:MAG: L-histidine N(alpha)-methyltransferase [Myxococcales bacterium]|nr:L-histidine N(alpha)-methyltransferase [Myxococcales bacterium]